MYRNPQHYSTVVERDLLSKLPRSQGAVPRLQSISLHISLQDRQRAADEYLLPALLALEVLSAQKPRLHFSKKALSHLQLQKGTLAGVSVKLRSRAMYAFLEELRTLILPNISGFEGIPLQSFDSQGNLNLRLENIIRFPALEEEYLHFQKGDPQAASSGRYLPLDISFHSSAQSSQEGLLLLTALQLPILPR